MKKPETIDEYIMGFPPETQASLVQLRQTIKQAAPGAVELISYGMPAFKLHKILVYFAGFTNHIGFYPTSSGIEKFRRKLSPYKSGKGSIQFPLGKKIPLKLVEEIVRFRVAEVLQQVNPGTKR